MSDFFQKQYALVVHARGILFDHIAADLGDAELIRPVPAYMGKSIRDLLVHGASCYFHWLAYLALKQPYGSMDEDGTTLGELRSVYARVNETMKLFLDHFSAAMEIPFSGVFDDGWRVRVTPHELFTHVTTHEFHHKGQIVLMSRLLGHAPPDTDVSNAFAGEAPV